MKKLFLFFAALCCTAMMQAEIVHHAKCDPTYRTVGYAQECWEDTSTGKFYADASCAQELNPAQVLLYAKLLSNPIIDFENFTSYKSETYEDQQFNWGVKMGYQVSNVGSMNKPTIEYIAKFKVYGTDVANARIKFYRNVSENTEYGTYDLEVKVNDEPVYALNNTIKSGFFSIPIKGIKTGDIVTFRILAPKTTVTWKCDLTMTACLEYTSSNGGKNQYKDITAIQDPNNKKDYYATFYSDETAYELPANARAYAGKVEDNVVRLSNVGNIIPKCTPVILKLTPGNISESQYQFTLVPTSADATYEGSNDLTGNGENTLEAEANTYCLGVENNVLGYHPFSGTIAANSAYLKFDEATDIGMYRIAEIGSNIVYHPQCEPTMEQYGCAQNCWEDTDTGKFYEDYSCRKELDPVRLLTYAKLLSNPIINSRAYKLTAYESSTYESNEFDGHQFNWGAYIKYYAPTGGYGPTQNDYTADFMVFGTDVANARFLWYRNVTEYSQYGIYDLKISVNGQPVFTLQNSCESGLHCIALPGLKTGDIVRFEYDAPKNEVTWAGDVIMTACLEYTSSNGGFDTRETVTAHQDPDNPENYYATFYSNEIAYSVPDNTKAYTAQVDGEKLLLSDIGNTIHKGEAVILKATGNSIELMPSANKEEASSQNDLTGTDEGKTLGTGDYALSLGQNGVGFYLWENKPIGANKAYLTLGGSEAKAFIFQFEDGTTTGILKPVIDEEKDGPAYDLNGIRVKDNHKGIVIKNGKKIYQK